MTANKKRTKPKRSTDSSNVDPLSLNQIEERLHKIILSASLALYITRNSRKPASKLVRELIQIEAEVGRFVGKVIPMQKKRIEMFCVKGGLLAGALSLVPINPIRRKET